MGINNKYAMKNSISNAFRSDSENFEHVMGNGKVWKKGDYFSTGGYTRDKRTGINVSKLSADEVANMYTRDKSGRFNLKDKPTSVDNSTSSTQKPTITAEREGESLVKRPEGKVRRYTTKDNPVINKLTGKASLNYDNAINDYNSVYKIYTDNKNTEIDEIYNKKVANLMSPRERIELRDSISKKVYGNARVTKDISEYLKGAQNQIEKSYGSDKTYNILSDGRLEIISKENINKSYGYLEEIGTTAYKGNTGLIQNLHPILTTVYGKGYELRNTSEGVKISSATTKENESSSESKALQSALAKSKRTTEAIKRSVSVTGSVNSKISSKSKNILFLEE